MADVPGTLRGYDIVLSISAEAINAQFQALYNKEIPQECLPPPPGFEDEGSPSPRPKYFIDHEFKVFVTEAPEEGAEGREEEELAEEDMDGVIGHIGCPQVKFHPTKPGVVIMSITFHRDETAEEEDRKDSVLRQWTVVRKKPVEKKYILNGWTFSWEANVEQRDIDDVVDKLINPAESPESDVQVTPEAIEQLKSKFAGVPSDTFTASSIFCVMEAAQMTDTFQLTPPPGQPKPSDEKWAILSALVIKKFQNRRDDAKGDENSHLPSRKNPFVLGYGIRQNVPDILDINPDADTSKTPQYFVPRKVDCTTTPSVGNEFTDGTLNFCMLTYRPSEMTDEPLIHINEDDRNAGQFKQTFFDKLYVRGGASSNDGGDGDDDSDSGSSTGRPAGHDGIMAFSKKIFNDMWLNDHIVKKLVANPAAYGHTLHHHSWDKTPVGLRKLEASTDKNAAIHRLEYEYDTIPCPSESTYEQKREASGKNEVDADYTSDFLRYSESERRQGDLKRNLYIDIKVYNELNLSLYTKGINSIAERWDFWNAIGEWMIGRTAFQRSQFKLGYTLSPGQGGIWAIAEDAARTTFPGPNVHVNTIGPFRESAGAPEGEPAEWRNWNRDGCQMWIENHHTFMVFGKKEEMAKFEGGAKAWYDYHDDELQAGIDNILGSLKGAVIMPAGNVLTFAGLDCDDQGHVYSHIDYMTLSDVKLIKH